MAATEQQLKQLKTFVGRRDGWELTSNNPITAFNATEPTTAVSEMEFSPSARYTLILEPVDGDQWKASSVSTWLPARDASTIITGNFHKCLTWLERREAKLHHERNTTVLLQDIADGRKGWTFTDRKDRPWAGRTFDYGRYGATLLSVQANSGLRSVPLLAQINLQFAAGPEVSQSGTWRDVQPWLDRWENVLVLPLDLAECTRIHTAIARIAEASNTMIAELAYLLDIDVPAPEAIRQRLITMFVPAKVRAQA